MGSQQETAKEMKGLFSLLLCLYHQRGWRCYSSHSPERNHSDSNGGSARWRQGSRLQEHPSRPQGWREGGDLPAEEESREQLPLDLLCSPHPPHRPVCLGSPHRASPTQ